MFAWGINKEGELSLAKTVETMFDQSGKIPCVNNPEKVVGLRGQNWPSMVASGIAHSIAIGQTEGVFACGSTAL